MQRVVIVESPTKAEHVARILGDSVRTVIATRGHLVDLPYEEMGVSISGTAVSVRLKTVEGQEQTVSEIRRVCLGADVIVATDPDREGEAIAGSVRKLLGSTAASISRVDLLSMSPSDVRNLLGNARPFDDGRMLAQRSRRAADRIIGYTLSPKVAEGLGAASTHEVSAGRVQAAVIRMVKEKEERILSRAEACQGEARVRLKFLDSSGAPFESSLKFPSSAAAAAAVDSIVAARSVFEVSGMETAPAAERSPAPLTTAEMIYAAHRFSGWKPERTMAAAQVLFERGMISYPRTDSTRLSEETGASLRNYLSMRHKDVMAERPVRHPDRSVYSAHEAVRPMNLSPDGEPDRAGRHGISGDMMVLYSLIWRSTLASQSKEAAWQRVRLVVTVSGGSGPGVEFAYAGKAVQNAGWRIFFPPSDEEKRIQEQAARQISRTRGERIRAFPFVSPVDPKNMLPYDEGRLVRAMAKRRVGTPGTFAPLLAKVERKGYLAVGPGGLVELTDKGRGVLSWLERHYPVISDVSFTKKMEEMLDEVEQHRIRWEDPVLLAAAAVGGVSSVPALSSDIADGRSMS